MYGLTRQAYKAYKKAHKMPQAEPKKLAFGGLLSAPTAKPAAQATPTKANSLEQIKKQEAQNAFSLFYNFNNRNKV